MNISRWNSAVKFIMYLLLINGRECLLVGARSTELIDLSMYLLYLPSLMNAGQLDNVTLATETLIMSDLSLYSTSVEDVTALVSSQTVNGRTAFGNNATFHVVEVNMQIIVEYRRGTDTYDDQSTLLIEDQIRMHVTEDWAEIQAMLMQLDPTFFENLIYVELKPKNSAGDDGNLNSSASEPIPDDVLMVYVVLGAGVSLVFLTVLIAYHFTRIRPKSESAQGTIISSFASEDEAPRTVRQHQPPNPEHRPHPPPYALNTTTDQLFVSGQGGGSHRKHIASKGKVRSADAPSVSSINSPSIQELKEHRHVAQHNLQESLRVVTRKVAVEPTNEAAGQGPRRPTKIRRVRPPLHLDRRSANNESQLPKPPDVYYIPNKRKSRPGQPKQIPDNGVGLRSTIPSGTCTPAPQPKTKRVAAVGTGEHRGGAIVRGRAPPTIANLNQQPCPPMNAPHGLHKMGSDSGIAQALRVTTTVAKQMTNKNNNNECRTRDEVDGDALIWSLVKHTNDHDGCSVSTITAGLGSILSAPTIEYIAGARDFLAESSIVNPQPRGTEYVENGTYDDDDFGSIADSCVHVDGGDGKN